MVFNEESSSRATITQFLLRDRLKLFENFGVKPEELPTSRRAKPESNGRPEPIPTIPRLALNKLKSGMSSPMRVAGFCAGRSGSITYRESSRHEPLEGPEAISFDNIIEKRPKPLSNQHIGFDQHEEALQRTLAEQAASIKDTFQSKARQQVADLMKVASKDISKQTGALDKVIEAYSNKFKSIISWIEETEKIKEHIKNLEEKVAAIRASNERMAANHEENVSELQEEYEILQLQLRTDLSHQQKAANYKSNKATMSRSVSMTEVARYHATTELPSIDPGATSNRKKDSFISITQQLQKMNLHRPSTSEPNKVVAGDYRNSLHLTQMKQTPSAVEDADKQVVSAIVAPHLAINSQICSTGESPNSLLEFPKTAECPTDDDTQVDILREKIRSKQNEVQSLESSLASFSQEPEAAQLDSDRQTRDQIEKIAAIEDSVEKSLMDEIAAVKRKLAESKEAAASIQKKLAKQRKQNEKLRNQVITAENKCRQAQTALEQELENEKSREQTLMQSFQEQKESIITIFNQIRECVYQCKRVTAGLESGLACPICLNEFQDPYLFSPCGHTCCHQCIPNTRLCPICCLDNEAPSTTAIATNQLLRRIVEQYRWFTDPMTKAGDAIINLVDSLDQKR